MNTRQTARDPAATDAEVQRLRARIAEVEEQLVLLQAWANKVVADAQERTYWLDRLHLDLDPIMRYVPFEFALGVYKKVRGVYRRLFNLLHSSS